MAPFIPVRAISRSQAVRIGKQTVKTGKTTYVDVGSQTETGGIKAGSKLPYSPFKELQNHLAIGAVIVVGPLTFTASDWAVQNGVVTTATPATGKEATIAVTVGVLRQRSTGAETLVEIFSAAEKSTIAGKERIDIITADESAEGAAKFKEGVAAVTGKAVQPQTTEQAKLAEYATKLAKAEITQKEYNEKVAALEKELLVATVTWVGVTEEPVVVNLNRV